MTQNNMNEIAGIQAPVTGLAAKGAAVNVLELFSGIGGFTKGLMDAGFKINKHYFSEIDKHAIANYKYNYPNAEYIGSVTDVRGTGIERPDIITFGSPCQDFSLAGKRKGMEGQRSSLILHAIRLIGECRPGIFIWENVKGAYSSNAGADFWGIIQAFANIGGYRLEWQLLNTSWFLPQNRERIYLIGHLAERSGRNVFPISESNQLYNEARSPKPSEIASTLNAGDNKSWVGNFLCVAQRGRNPENPSDRTTGAHTEQRFEANSQGTTNTLTGVQKDNLILVKSNTEKGFEEAKEGDSINFSNPSSRTRRGRVGKGKAQTLDTACNQGVIAGTWRTHNDGKGFREVEDGNSPTLPARAREDGSGQSCISTNGNIRRLTEIECERLQGFPDNWTEYGNYDGVIKKIPKTQRYKMLGNAVTTNVVKAIGERLLAVAPFAACQ